MKPSMRRPFALALAPVAVAAMAALAAPTAAEALCMARPMFGRHYYQARQALRDGRPLEAIELFRRAARSPMQAKIWVSGVWYELGATSQAAAQHARAVQHFRAALKEHDTHYAAAFGLLRSLQASQGAAAALAEIDSLSPTLRSSQGILGLEARLAAQAGDRARMERAVEALRARGWLTPQTLTELRRLSDGVPLLGPGKLGNL